MFKIKFAFDDKEKIKAMLNIEESSNYQIVIGNDQNDVEKGKINIILSSDQIDELSNVLKFKQEDHNLVGKNNRGSCKINISDIYYVEALGNDVYCYTKDECFNLKEKLYQLEENLAKDGLVRIGKSYLVNINKIKFFKPSLAAKILLVLDNDKVLEVNRSYVKGFRNYLKMR